MLQVNGPSTSTCTLHHASIMRQHMYLASEDACDHSRQRAPELVVRACFDACGSLLGAAVPAGGRLDACHRGLSAEPEDGMQGTRRAGVQSMACMQRHSPAATTDVEGQGQHQDHHEGATCDQHSAHAWTGLQQQYWAQAAIEIRARIYNRITTICPSNDKWFPAPGM